jgi:hypothetical protein
MNCFFCSEQRATKSDPPFKLCDRCYKEREEVKERLKQPLINEQQKDVGRLCLRCGVCCFMLSARCTDEEAERIEKDHGISVDRLSHIEAIGPNQGKRVLKVPCKLLKGKPLDHAFCKAYRGFRPEVCHSYMCKIAQRYSLGMMSYHEALFWMRTALITGDVSIFNWTSEGDQDDRLMVASMIGNFADNLRNLGADQQHINLAVAERVTPRYFFKSPQDRLALEMHFSAFDRGDIDPTLFVTKDKISYWAPEVHQFAVEMIRAVMEEIRSYFEKENSTLTDMLQKLGAEGDDDKKITPDSSDLVEDVKESNGAVLLDLGRFEELEDHSEKTENSLDLLDWLHLIMRPEDLPEQSTLNVLTREQYYEVIEWCEKVMMKEESEPGSAPECLRKLLPDGAFYKDWKRVTCAHCGCPLPEEGCDCTAKTVH